MKTKKIKVKIDTNENGFKINLSFEGISIEQLDFDFLRDVFQKNQNFEEIGFEIKKQNFKFLTKELIKQAISIIETKNKNHEIKNNY